MTNTAAFTLHSLARNLAKFNVSKGAAREEISARLFELALTQCPNLGAKLFPEAADARWALGRNFYGDIVGYRNDAIRVHVEIKGYSTQFNRSEGECNRPSCAGPGLQTTHFAEDGAPIYVVHPEGAHCRKDFDTDDGYVPVRGIVKFYTWQDVADAMLNLPDQELPDPVPALLRLK